MPETVGKSAGVANARMGQRRGRQESGRQRRQPRAQLLDLARGRAANALDRSIDTQVSRLRRKLELDPGEPKIIKTVWGGGYMFTPAVSQQ